MRHSLALTLATLLVGGLLGAVPPAASKQASLLCTLTNQRVEKCCCEPRGSKLYCPLAKKTLDTCCCKPAEGQKAKKT